MAIIKTHFFNISFEHKDLMKMLIKMTEYQDEMFPQDSKKIANNVKGVSVMDEANPYNEPLDNIYHILNRLNLESNVQDNEFKEINLHNANKLIDDINDKIELVSIDVSFISLTKVLVPVKKLMAEDGQIVCLIKPQFEAGREKVGKKGVVREKSTHLEVINMVIDFAVEAGFEVLNLEFSPIKGPEGNIEYLLHLQNHRDGEHYDNVTVDPAQVVEAAHSELDK